jgi:hypothetical protein
MDKNQRYDEDIEKFLIPQQLRFFLKDNQKK